MKLVGQLTQKGQMGVAGHGHAEYTILVLDDTRPLKLVVTCDSPPQSEIELVIWEFNPPVHTSMNEPLVEVDPSTNGTEGAFDPAARTFDGNTEVCLKLKGKIKQTRDRTWFEPNPGYVFAKEYPNRRSVLVDFGDGVPRRIPIPRKPEFELDMWGIVWKLIVRFQVGSKAFETPWVALRDYRHATPKGRPVVAIIMMTLDEQGDHFKDIARKFWAQHADIVRTEETMENALAFLRDSPDTPVIGPWGEVNIVAHGWFIAWNVALLNPENLVPGMEHHAGDGWVSAGELEDAIATGHLKAPSKAALDSESRVVIRGCVLGNDATLSRTIAALFGGLCPVYVSKMIQGYSYDRDSIGAFAREVAAYSYGTHGGNAVAQPPATAAKHFSDKYDFALSAPLTKRLGRWTARISESDRFGTNAHFDVNLQRQLGCEVDYPANAPDALAWVKSQLSMAPSPFDISRSFFSEFTADKSQLQTFEAERDAFDANPEELGGKSRRQPYLWGTTRNTFEWRQPTVRRENLVNFRFSGWVCLISFEHRNDDPLDPDSWAKSKRAPVEIFNKRQFRRVG